MLEQNLLGYFLKMEGLVKLVLGLSAIAVLSGCAVKKEEYVEPVQQVDMYNYDYDYPVETIVNLYLKEVSSEQEADREYQGKYYKIVPSGQEDLILTETQIIWEKRRFGDDRGEDERDQDIGTDREQSRDDREADIDR